MVIISYSPIRDYMAKKPDVKAALEDWYFKVKAAEWKNIAELKQTFNSVDFVGNDRFVFNIKGNHYRLVAMIFFNRRTLYIRFIGTHEEYDAVDVSII